MLFVADHGPGEGMTLRQESGNISAAAVGCDEHRQPLIACLT